MKAVMKVCLIIAFGLSISAPAMAQAPHWSQRGDYYAPNRTIMQQSTPQELNEFRGGDYYAPGRSPVQQPSARELNEARHGDYYAPGRY
jgi:hypothetical protein